MKKMFLVQGSEVDPYSVEFLRQNSGLKIGCTCQAGSFSQFCKHIEAVLNMDKIALPNYSKADILQLQEIIGGTKFESNYQILSGLLKEKEALDKKIKALKKSILN